MDNKRFRELYREFSKGYQELYDRRPVIHKGYEPRKPIYMSTFGEAKFLDEEQYVEYSKSSLYKTNDVIDLIFNKTNDYSSLKFVKRIDKSVLWNIQGYNSTLKIIYEHSLKNYNKKLKKLSLEKHVPLEMVNNDEYRKTWRVEVTEFLTNAYSQLLNEMPYIHGEGRGSYRLDIKYRKLTLDNVDFYSSINAMSSTSPHYNRDNLTPRIAKKMFRKICLGAYGYDLLK